jgi:hypothetical protein
MGQILAETSSDGNEYVPSSRIKKFALHSGNGAKTMAVKILFANLRISPPHFKKCVVPWYPQLTAQASLHDGLPPILAQQIVEDLKTDNHELTVAWNSLESDDHSDIGGLAALDWEIPDNSILSITYENDVTTQQAIDDCIQWMLANERT